MRWLEQKLIVTRGLRFGRSTMGQLVLIAS